ncbi:hypothetical protein [Actinophytocola algeriensis]|uniref:Uncharacterized protein n=1 Tax=Actinophytocola algeriensis TaxID=1768010 RepID=A0A7W7VBG7_9PSEU|nr:hypothetical protein [Actinophytocola algeriensis]MBB4903989.1 hypothetical protein [Actinophytocola algeriensis]MBE1477154.1 hypothetical protein [Actinophytocola algeriensis]
MNAALTKPSTMDSLIGAYRSHVLGRNLPDPASLDFTPSTRLIMVQPSGGLDLSSRLGGLLVWAYTLTDLTASWTHTADDRLHVGVNGRTAGGARITVYSGGPFAECCGLVPLAHDQREGVSLDELYTLVGLLREHGQHEREVA